MSAESDRSSERAEKLPANSPAEPPEGNLSSNSPAEPPAGNLSSNSPAEPPGVSRADSDINSKRAESLSANSTAELPEGSLTDSDMRLERAGNLSFSNTAEPPGYSPSFSNTAEPLGYSPSSNSTAEPPGWSPSSSSTAEPPAGTLEGALEEVYRTVLGEPAPEDKTKTLAQRVFPTGFLHELAELFKLAWPIIMTLFLNILISPVSLALSGHLGKLELDAVAMAISIANVIGTSIAVGMIAACDTFFAQSFGSSNKKQVGVYLQTAILVASLTCLIAWALIFNTNYILLKLGQNPDVARMTEEYLYLFMPAIYFMFMYQLMAKYLQVQHIVLPSVIIGVVCNGVNAALQYYLIYTLEFGFRGSAIGQGITYLLLATGTIAYIVISKAYKSTWSGWSRASLLDWGEFMTLGMSSLFMICLEWWAFEVATFLMGILGETELGASSIIFQLWNLYGSVPIGIGAACSIKVGRYLGARNPEGALTVARTSIVISWVVALVAAVIILALRHELPVLFSDDPDVIALTVDLLPILAIFAFFGANKWICVGVVRGTGRQVVGGVVAFVSYFVFAMPIGIPLMFLTSLRAAGFWWGLNIGLIIAALCFLFIVFRTDFRLEAERAQLRAKSATTEKKAKVHPLAVEKVNPLALEKQALVNPLKGGSMYPSLIDSNSLSSYGSVGETTGVKVPSYATDAEMSSVGSKAWRHLIWRRLTAASVCLVVLIVGVLCRFFVLLPEDILPVDWQNVTALA